MRIDRNQALKYYENTKSVSSVKVDNTNVPSSASNTDRISISSEAARQAEFGSTVQHIAAEVETSVSSARLQQLSAQIEAGEYRVPTHQLAASILNYLG
ncbi:flagellar biosynthesis anti-sigma factor FlgM [Oscillospiraceae bacterium LTW-04]|nr:flagellar biosynthesis anti-sigma factor FlgM [Oscillospiraceae bacterium MB24-C1]